LQKQLKPGRKIKLDVKDQINNYNRTCTESTIEWWSKQPKVVRDTNIKPSKHDFSVIDGCRALSHWIRTTNYSFKESFVWSRGSHFDFPKIGSLYEDSGENLPYNEWKIRDIRTYIDILVGRSDGQYELQQSVNSFTKHDCLHDAAMDATRLNEIYQKVMVGEDPVSNEITEDDIPF
jgi:hypothetical protein